MHAFESSSQLPMKYALSMLMAVCLAIGAGVVHADESDLSGKRIAVLIGEGFHDGETVFPMGYLVNRGAELTVIGIEEGYLQAYNSSLRMKVTHAVSDVGIDDFDALILPGGRGPSVLRENEEVVAFAKAFFESGKPVAAICHGPQVLVTAGVLEGRTSTGVGGIQEEIEGAGAQFVDEEVVVDGNLITSRLPGDLPAFSAAIAEALAEKEEA